MSKVGLRKTILVVDDDQVIIESVTAILEQHGFDAIGAATASEALNKVSEEPPDLILLDVVMPDLDGFEILKRIREAHRVPVIFCTGRHDETDRIRGLDMGADDYLTKPFSLRELVSRVNAVLRRSELGSSLARSEIEIDHELRIDFERHRAMVRGNEVHLRPTECRLLYELVTNAGKVLPADMLLARVWGPAYSGESLYVRVYVAHLRHKLERDPSNPQYIMSERGMGYFFKGFDLRDSS